jgi:hypothetical protein
MPRQLHASLVSDNHSGVLFQLGRFLRALPWAFIASHRSRGARCGCCLAPWRGAQAGGGSASSHPYQGEGGPERVGSPFTQW